jgi:hypothetical protein
LTAVLARMFLLAVAVHLIVWAMFGRPGWWTLGVASLIGAAAIVALIVEGVRADGLLRE